MSASGRVSVTLPIDVIIADLGADNVNNNQVKSWRKDSKILQTFPFQAQIFETEAVENNRGQVIGVALEKYNNIFESVLLSYNSVGYKRCPQGQIGASFSRKGSG